MEPSPGFPITVAMQAATTRLRVEANDARARVRAVWAETVLWPFADSTPAL